MEIRRVSVARKIEVIIYRQRTEMEQQIQTVSCRAISVPSLWSGNATRPTAMEGTVLCTANYAPLTPISFLERSALVYPDRPAIVSSGDRGGAPRSWRETRGRCLRLAAALAALGVAGHDVVIRRLKLLSFPAFCNSVAISTSILTFTFDKYEKVYFALQG